MAVPAASSKGENNSGISSSLSNYSNKVVLIISVVNLVVTCFLGFVIFLSFQKDKQKISLDGIVMGLERSQDVTALSEKSDKQSEQSKISNGVSMKESAAKVQETHGSTGHFGKMLNLDQFTINLATVGGVSPKFVRVDVSLEVPNTDAEAEVSAKMPQVRNVIIDLFNSKRSTDLSTVDGREVLKEDIKNALNSFMVSGKITGVFFTSFAVSS